MVNSQLSSSLRKAVKKNFPAQKQFLSRLVKTKSVNECTPEQSDKSLPVEREVAKLLYQKLSSFKFSPRRIGVTRARPNVVCYWGPGRYRKSLILNGHMDTVPPAENAGKNPFSGKVRGGRLYGVGVLDMKASLSAYVFALKALRDAGVDLDGRIILEFVVDEEPGACSKLGTHHLLSRSIRAKAAIVAEPGPQIGIGHRGGYRFKLTTHGEAVHTGVSAWQRKEKGRNAITDMMRVVRALEGLDIPFRPSKVFVGKKPMMTFPTIIKGGVSVNMVPDTCVAWGDARLMPGNSDKQVRLLIEEALAKLGDIDYTLEDHLFAPAIEMDEKEEIVQVLAEEYTKTTRKQPILDGIGPWNDAWMLAAQGIPTVTQVPLEGGGAHGKDEWVSLRSLEQLTLTLARTAVSFLGLRTGT